MVLLDKLMTLIGKITEAVITLMISLPLILITYVVIYTKNIIINLFKK